MSYIESKENTEHLNKNNQKGIDYDILYLKNNIELSDLKGLSRKGNRKKESLPENNEFKYLRETQDKKYFVYKHEIPESVQHYTTVNLLKNKIKRQLNLSSTNGILITDQSGKLFSLDYKFKAGDVIYFKVPKNVIETGISVDEMRLKGNYYLGTDLSKFNGDMDLDAFTRWNRSQRDSDSPNKKGISFAYIRASDDLSNDSSIDNHIDKIKQYNRQEIVKNNHEQIAYGIYHRLSGSNPIEQAKVFVKQRKKYSNVNNCLIPMVDVEDGGAGGWVTTAIRRGESGKNLIRNNTLKRLKKVEKETGVIPGIYTGYSVYKDVFDGDARFDKYKTWIASYSSSRKVDADMRQFSENGKIGGIPGKVDLNRTGDIQSFLA